MFVNKSNDLLFNFEGLFKLSIKLAKVPQKHLYIDMYIIYINKKIMTTLDLIYPVFPKAFIRDWSRSSRTEPNRTADLS
jgi:hypothetical protein